MARPDDDHVPQVIVGDDGEVIAVTHMSPDAGPEAVAAIREPVEAVRRKHGAHAPEEWATQYSQDEADRARIRALRERFGRRQ